MFSLFIIALKVLVGLTGFILKFPFLLQIYALLFPNRDKSIAPSKTPSIAIIVTAYKSLSITHDLLKSIQNQGYSNFTTYVVADRCNDSEQQIDDSNINYLFPPNPLDSKVKSIQYALENGAAEFEKLIILDPDNVLDSNFLQNIIRQKNKEAVINQGNRLPKNLDTPTACLDAAGEFFRNRMDRDIPSRIGVSATISGSGFMVDTAFYQQFLKDTKILERANSGEIITGEDKELQNYIVEQDKFTSYTSKAKIYDQKLKHSVQVENQRARWISAYFKALPGVLENIISGLASFQIRKAVFFMISAYPPITLLALISAVLLAMSLMLKLYFLSNYLIASGIIFAVNYFLALSLSNAPSSVWKSFLFLPVFVFRMILGLFKISKTKKDFLPTDHGK